MKRPTQETVGWTTPGGRADAQSAGSPDWIRHLPAGPARSFGRLGSEPSIASSRRHGRGCLTRTALIALGLLFVPASVFSSPTEPDDDGDGLPNAFETLHGLRSDDPTDAALDPDQDFLTNLGEYQQGCDPHDPDTDGDSLPDGWEVRFGTDPKTPPPVFRGFHLAVVAQSAEASDAVGLTVWANHVYVGDGSAGLRVFAYDGATNLTLVHSVPTTGYANYPTIASNFLYLPARTAGLEIYDLSTPSVPRRVNSLDTPGVAWQALIRDGRLYLSDSSYGLHIYDLSHPTNPVLRTTYDTPANAFGFDFYEDHGLIADGWDGLHILDLSNPAAPVSVLANPVALGYAYAVRVAGAYAYVATSDDGLRILDIHDPAHPVLVGTQATPDVTSYVDVVDGFAYVADQFSGLHIIDVSDPAQPRLDASFDTAGSAQSLLVVSNRIFVADGQNGLVVLEQIPRDADADGMPDDWETATFGHLNQSATTDWDGDGLLDAAEFLIGSNPQSDSSDPDGLTDTAEVRSHNTHPARLDSDQDDLTDAEEILTYHTLPYLADTDGDGMRDGYEIRYSFDPFSPADGALNPDHDFLDNRGESLANTDPNNADTDGDSLFDGWEVRYGTDPLAMPPAISGLNLATLGTSHEADGAQHVSIRSNYVYMSDSMNGLKVFDQTDLNQITLVSTYDTGGEALMSVIEGDLLYLADGEGGLLVFDLTSPTNPVPVGSVPTDGYVTRLAIYGDFLYLIEDSQGLGVFDIATRTNPVRVTTNGTWDSAQGLDIQDHYLYVATSDAGLEILDLGDPANPRLVGRYPLDGYITSVAVAGDYAYLAVDFVGVLIVNILDPGNPVLVATYEEVFNPNAVRIAGHFAYIADYRSGVHVLDIADPAQPQVAATFATEGWLQSLEVLNDRIYAVLTYWGFQVLRQLPKDGDGDGMEDTWELTHFGHLDQTATTDFDADNVFDAAEYLIGSDPAQPHTDADGIADGDEVTRHNTHPVLADSDADGLSDGDEIAVYFTQPTQVDSDGDGLEDGDEVRGYLTSPTATDSDGDGALDGEEMTRQTDATDAGHFPARLAGLVHYSGTQTGLIHLIATSSNLYERALWLDGNGDYAARDPVQLPVSSTFSVEAWVYPTALPDGDRNGIIRWGYFFFGLRNSGFPSAGFYLNSQDFLAWQGPRAVMNAWNYVACTVNGREMTLHVNGVSSTRVLNTNPRMRSEKLALGCTDYPGRCLGGFLDEVRVWDRTLSIAELEAHRQWLRLTGTESNLVAYWNFNSRLPRDMTTNANHASLRGDAITVATNALPLTHTFVTQIAAPGGFVLPHLPTEADYDLFLFRDANGNGLLDTWEARGSRALTLTNHLPDLLLQLEDPTTDSDGDRLTDYDEVYLHQTNPYQADSDQDTILDDEEVAAGLDGFVTNPNSADTDGDLMSDPWEVQHGLRPTDPQDAFADDDGEGLVNVLEFLNGTDPKVADTDEDALSDHYEVTFDLNPLDAQDAASDFDGDGLPVLAEQQAGTNPVFWDTDGDGLPDGWELHHGLNPLACADGRQDGDADRLSNDEEYAHGTDPHRPDTDGDSLPDGWEVLQGLDPASPFAPLTGIGLELRASVVAGGEIYHLAIESNIVYVAAGSRGLHLYSVTNLDQPTFLAALDTPGSCRHVTKSGSLLYLADFHKGLAIVDVGDPARPVLVGAYDSPGNTRAIAVRSNLVCLADSAAGLVLVDATTATNPVLKATFDTPGQAMHVQVHSNLAYVADYDGGLQLVSLANPASPQLVGQWNAPGYATAVEVVSNLAYVAVLGSGLAVVDVTIPTNPVHLATLELAGQLRSLTLAGPPACLADADGSLCWLDLDSPAVPAFLGRSPLPCFPQSVWLEADTVFIAGGHAGWHIYHWLGPLDADRDGLPDAWETARFGSTDPDAEDDFDGDQLTNRGEYLAGLNPTLADQDADGMPDGWEVRHWLDPRADDAQGDLDADRMTNGHEQVAGTDPADARSVLALRCWRSGPEATLQWPSIAGKSYDLGYTPNLVEPFQIIAAEILALPPTNTFTVSNTWRNGFFRLGVR